MDHATGEKPKIPRNILVIAFVALASGLGQDLITPVLPAYLGLLGFTSAGIGLIDGLLQGSTSVFRLVSGILSDKFRNRKRLVFLGYALSSVSRPLLGFASSFGAIAGLRLVDGVGKGSKDAPRDALVADSAAAGTKGRAFGFHRLVDTAGSVIGPLIAAGVLLILTPSLASYRLIFFLAVIPGAVALALIIFGIRESAPAQAPAAGQRALPWSFWIFTSGVTVAMLTKINDSLFLVRAGHLGMPPVWVPVIFAGFTLLYALLSYPIGIWSDRIGKMPLIVGGWLTLAAVEFGFSFRIPLASSLVLFGFYGVFYALTEGSARAFIAEAVPYGSRGTAYAAYYTLTGLAVIAGGYGLGHIWDAVSPEFAFRLSSAGSLLSCLILAAAFFAHARKTANAPSEIK
ncbi:MAG: MFS transporter [Patescibacteria group bacterium]|jgi:MFS family permease